MTLEAFVTLMEGIAPLALQEDFDHSGLQCGEMHQEIHTILLALDCTEAVVQEAIAKGAQLIVTHHPLLFHPIQDLTDQGYVQRILRKLVRHNIALFAAHTNLDNVDGGVCDALAHVFALENTEKILDSGMLFCGKPQGYGRIGDIPPVALRDFAAQAKQKLQAARVAFVGDPGRIISRLAVASGSGGVCFAQAAAMGADCILSAEIKHSVALEFAAQGVCLVDAGHYATEKVVLPVLQERLQSALIALQYTVSVLRADADRDVFAGV